MYNKSANSVFIVAPNNLRPHKCIDDTTVYQCAYFKKQILYRLEGQSEVMAGEIIEWLTLSDHNSCLQVIALGHSVHE